MTWAVFTIAASIAAVGPLMAQTPGASESFEVASVKPGNSSFQGISVYAEPGRFLVTNATLKFLIGYAWRIQGFQIYGGPAWTGTELFSIEAKPGDANYERMLVKLRHLLEERFSLETHGEKRTLPVYEMEIAKGGPKLTRAAGPAKGGTSTGRGMVTVTDGSVGTLAEALAGQVGRPVLDRTGLDGAFDMKLRWTPDVESHDVESHDANGPSLFTAIQEQLGLKLEAAKAPVEVLVIDRVERPTGN